MIHKFNTLYARNSAGKIVKWNIEVQNNNGQVDIKRSYGQYDGSQSLNWQRDIQGKNIGKENETNSWQQAIKECESRINRQKQKGYVTLEEARTQYNIVPIQKNTLGSLRLLVDDNRDSILIELDKLLPKYRTDLDGNVKPMKASQYYRSEKNWTDPDGKIWKDRKYYYLLNPYAPKEDKAVINKFPCMGQPKINGIRCTIRYTNNKPILKSKEGKVYNVAHIEDFLTLNSDIFNLYPNLVLDGELYIHGELLQDIRSAVVKPNLNTPRVKFILFDLAIENETNLSRWNFIKHKIKPILDQYLNCCIEVIRTVKITNDTSAQKLTDLFISQGYEGSIFRQEAAMYGFGSRKQSMTKLKRCISDEFKITDIVPQEKDNTKGNYRCITKEGLYFDVTPDGVDFFKRELLLNKHDYIGKNLTCDFYEWTKDNKPFHVLRSTVRDYE